MEIPTRPELERLEVIAKLAANEKATPEDIKKALKPAARLLVTKAELDALGSFSDVPTLCRAVGSIYLAKASSAIQGAVAAGVAAEDMPDLLTKLSENEKPL